MEKPLLGMSDSEARVEFFELGPAATGTIEPREDQAERLEEFTLDVGSGNHHVATDILIPCGCIDGRPGCSIKPNAAGGTNTLAAAEDLTNSTSVGYLESYDKVVDTLKEAGLPIGGHDDSHTSDQKSGCGACDRLRDIYISMAANGDTLRETVSSLGTIVSDATHETIIVNVAVREDFPAGNDIRQRLVDNEGEVDHLRDEHDEVLIVLNFRYGTTLDRDSIEAKYGKNYKAFNVDVWSFEDAAKLIASSDEDAANKLVAMLYYNFGTANVLCGPKMRVVVLR